MSLWESIFGDDKRKGAAGGAGGQVDVDNSTAAALKGAKPLLEADTFEEFFERLRGLRNVDPEECALVVDFGGWCALVENPLFEVDLEDFEQDADIGYVFGNLQVWCETYSSRAFRLMKLAED